MINSTTSQPGFVKIFGKGQRAPRRAPSNTAVSPVSTTIPRSTAPPASPPASCQLSWDDLIEQPKEMAHLLCGTSSPAHNTHARHSVCRFSTASYLVGERSTDYYKLGSARSKKRIPPSL